MKAIIMPRSTSGWTALALAAVSLGLAGCDSPREDALEQKADTVEEAYDAQADRLEEQADTMTGAAEDRLENKAEAVEESGEAKADAVEDKADQY
ncbi:hypothetical protein GCM10011494_06710 [Novosphingobium endophyticum]|uniref:Lipoprotein n=1 Tax=Novosphingobium endophyticum TaxID=1955250 RepID=A0A916X4B3_9SPHN|nr:hypothetical protein [Novosphingobium endophyticum]GGB91005.1 hypothetical protein GCM10011494_06710 [Novosphingobium endophyticum]